MRKLQPTEFEIALYRAEPEEHDLRRWEVADPNYKRASATITMTVDKAARELTIVITFTGVFTGISGEASHIALLGDGKMLRAKRIEGGPLKFHSDGVFNLHYALSVNQFVN